MSQQSIEFEAAPGYPHRDSVQSEHHCTSTGRGDQPVFRRAGARGGAAALMVEVMALRIAFPERLPLSSYTCDSVVRTRRCGQVLRALRQGGKYSSPGGGLSAFALHSLSFGAATTLAAGGAYNIYVAGWGIQRAGCWARDSDTFTIYPGRHCGFPLRFKSVSADERGSSRTVWARHGVEPNMQVWK